MRLRLAGQLRRRLDARSCSQRPLFRWVMTECAFHDPFQHHPQTLVPICLGCTVPIRPPSHGHLGTLEPRPGCQPQPDSQATWLDRPRHCGFSFTIIFCTVFVAIGVESRLSSYALPGNSDTDPTLLDGRCRRIHPQGHTQTWCYSLVLAPPVPTPPLYHIPVDYVGPRAGTPGVPFGRW